MTNVFARANKYLERRVPPLLADPVDVSRPYFLSYLIMTWAIAGIAIVLPIVFIVAKRYISGSVEARGSMSAYYHTVMQEIFIGALTVIAVLLIAYRSGEPRRLVFAISALSGLALLGVVYFPTNFSDPDAATCAKTPHQPGCDLSLSEAAAHGEITNGKWHGASVIATMHGIFAISFIATLCVISVLFAFDKRLNISQTSKATHLICAAVIFLAGVEAIAGFGVWQLTRLYIAETASVWAFGVSWCVAGVDLGRHIRSSIAPMGNAWTGTAPAGSSADSPAAPS